MAWILSLRRHCVPETALSRPSILVASLLISSIQWRLSLLFDLLSLLLSRLAGVSLDWSISFLVPSFRFLAHGLRNAAAALLSLRPICSSLRLDTAFSLAIARLGGWSAEACGGLSVAFRGCSVCLAIERCPSKGEGGRT